MAAQSRSGRKGHAIKAERDSQLLKSYRRKRAPVQRPTCRVLVAVVSTRVLLGAYCTCNRAQFYIYAIGTPRPAVSTQENAKHLIMSACTAFSMLLVKLYSKCVCLSTTLAHKSRGGQPICRNSTLPSAMTSELCEARLS